VDTTSHLPTRSYLKNLTYQVTGAAIDVHKALADSVCRRQNNIEYDPIKSFMFLDAFYDLDMNVTL
jgi:hypothetical protein